MAISYENHSLWQQLVEADRLRGKLIQTIFRELAKLDEPVDPDTDPLACLLRQSMQKPTQQHFGVRMTELLPQSYHCALVDELLTIAVENAEPQTGGPRAHSLLTALPQDWLASHFRPAVTRRIKAFGVNSGLLLLCSEIEPELAQELGKAAAESDDEYQRDIGTWILGIVPRAGDPNDASNERLHRSAHR